MRARASWSCNIAGKQAGFLVDEVNDIVGIGEPRSSPHPMSRRSKQSVIAGLVRIATPHQGRQHATKRA
jgi:chemotaxis signal transduction protein